MKTTTFFQTLLLVLLLAAAGNGAMAQEIIYEPYNFREVNEDGDTLYYRITSNTEPYAVAVTRCHDSTYHKLPVPHYAYEVGQPGFAYPVYDYDSLINIPPSVTHEGVTYTVTAIDIEAFYYQQGMRVVNLPSTIETIDSGAFYLSSLAEITLQEGVQRINAHAFRGTLIRQIDLPLSLLHAGSAVFASCRRLQSIVIPANITKIPQWCFLYCDSLSNVILPEEIDTIEESAFSGTSSLHEITIPSQVRYIGYFAFNYGGSSYPQGNVCFSIKCENPPTLENNAIIYDTIIFKVPCGALAMYQNAWFPDYYLANSANFMEDCDAVEEQENCDIKVYPNPASDVIHIGGLENGSHQLFVYDMFGKLITSSNAFGNVVDVNITHLLEGVYLLKIVSTNGQVYDTKIYKQ